MPVTLTLPKPHAAQQRVIEASRRFSVVCCGRRWGKSTLGIDRIIGDTLKGAPTAWFAPTYKMLQDIFRELVEILTPIIKDKSETERRIAIAGGGSIEAWSLDSAGDSARGRKYKLIVIDECALVPELERAWQSTLRPMLADLRGGAWFLSTPRGAASDFANFFHRGQDPTRSDFASFQMPTSSNPFIDSREIEAARLDMSEAQFAQEFEAAFISWEGSVFRRLREAATAPSGSIRDPNHRYALGVDWGRSVDYTVFVVIDATTGQVVEIDRSNRADYSVQVGRLKALCGRWRPSAGIAELNSIGQPVLEQVWREGMPIEGFTTSNVSKAAIIEGLALAFERGEVSIPNDPVLLGELQAFRAEPLPSGMMRYSAPAGQHDDCVMALALAWLAARRFGMGPQVTLYMDPYTGAFGPEPRMVQISPI